MEKWCILVVTQVRHWFGGRGGFISYKQLRLVTPPPMSIIEKMVRFGCSVSSSLIQGRGGFISYFILSKITILNKINEKLRPPLPPCQLWKKWCILVVARVHHWFGGMGGFISYFILSKIAILHKINEKLRPPLPPISVMKKMVRFGCDASSSLIWGEG